MHANKQQWGVNESLRLAALLGLIALEKAFRTILTLCYALCPFKGILDRFYHHAAFLQRIFSKRFEGPARPELNATTSELLGRMGLRCEDVRCLTDDGYVLKLHRLCNGCAVNGEDMTGRPVVLMVHGLLMSSEVFVIDEQVSLAAWLFHRGFDVWLGNSRGNKYSWQHSMYSRASEKYWDFCIDDMANYDVPAMERLIVEITGQPRIGYVGFSNGTAQLFAALAAGKTSAIGTFVAIAPACRIMTLNPDSVALRWLYPLLGQSPAFFSALFGRKAFLSVALQWQKLLSPQLFTAAILFCLQGLFSWDCRNLTEPLRTQLFAHLYSTCSAKTVNQWFRMLNTGRFEHYEPQADLSIYVEPYRMDMIRIPVTLIYGGRDKLSDVQWLMQGIKNCKAHVIREFEHLDFLACPSVEYKMFPIVERALREEFCKKEDDTSTVESASYPTP